MQHAPPTTFLTTALVHALLGSAALASAAPPQAEGTGSAPAPAGASQDERLEALEAENAELRRRTDLIAEELERLKIGTDVAPPIGAGERGLAPAASKVYGVEGGLSIGGYGEFLYENFQSGDDDQFDALRAVLYFGYRFDERWLFNSEIEFEHASTGANPDGSSGSASVEFAYVDYAASDALGFRGGLLLVPMGFVNELHEPTTFLSAERPVTETVIMPSTWRENGVGLFGEAGDFSWRSYVVTGLEGKEFDAGGLRGGRQKGNRADAEDLAWVGRVDWLGQPGLVVGGSLYVGDSGQDVGPDVSTTIAEVHAEYRRAGWHVRALAAQAELDDVDELNAVAAGGPLVGMDSIGEELRGAYLEVGYDVMSRIDPASGAALTPFVRYETVDTQADVPDGFASDPANDLEILTFGVAWQPFPNVIFKLDYQDRDDDAGSARDQWNFSIGYVF